MNSPKPSDLDSRVTSEKIVGRLMSIITEQCGGDVDHCDMSQTVEIEILFKEVAQPKSKIAIFSQNIFTFLVGVGVGIKLVSVSPKTAETLESFLDIATILFQ